MVIIDIRKFDQAGGWNGGTCGFAKVMLKSDLSDNQVDLLIKAEYANYLKGHKPVADENDKSFGDHLCHKFPETFEPLFPPKRVRWVEVD